MRRIAAFLCALVLSVACGLPALAQIPIAQLPSAPTPPNPSAVTIVSVGTQSYKAGAAWMGAFLGATPTATLATYAQQVGVTLCTGDGVSDQLAVNAAYTAMQAVSTGSGLYVSIPACQNLQANLLLANRSGWIAAPGSVRLHVARSSGSTAVTCAVALDNAYDTGWLVSGITLDGGYDGSQTAWLDHQHGLCLVNAFNGISDATYIANSTVGAQNPRGTVQNVLIANYGGDCARIIGSGANNFQFQTFNCGGHGAYINQYDSKFQLEIGSTGLSGIYLDANGSVDQFTNTKVWFTGSRNVSADKYGLAIVLGEGNLFDGVVQDTFCDGVYVTGANNIVRGLIQWQSIANSSVCTNAAAITSVGALQNVFDVSVNLYNPYSHVAYLVNDVAAAGPTYTTYSTFRITQQGMQSDTGTWNTAWFNGPLGFTNLVTLNAMQRNYRFWQPSTVGSDQQILWTGIDTSVGGLDGLVFDQTHNSTTLSGGAGGLCIDAQAAGVYTTCAITVDAAGHFLTPNMGGPYANDTAAAAGGVPLQGLYYDSSGLVHRRLT